MDYEKNKKQVIASRLKEFRKLHNLTQQGMCDAMGCSQSAYSSYENAESSKFPSVEMLINLNSKYNTSLDWLLDLEHKQTEEKANTVSDILECLFAIDDNLDITIREYEEEKTMIFDGEYPEKYIEYRHGIFFEKHRYVGDFFDSFIKELGEIKDFCKGKDIGTTMYDLWKKDKLDKNRMRMVTPAVSDGFLQVPDGVEDEGLPFI